MKQPDLPRELPGPWTVVAMVDSDDYDWLIRAANGIPVAYLSCPEAVARYIASCAPVTTAEDEED